MPESTLGVGIIGVSPVRGWAATAHIPALRALPNQSLIHNSDPTRLQSIAFAVL
jgi:predicted dehydrogenase